LYGHVSFYIKGWDTIELADMKTHLKKKGPIAVGIPWIEEMGAVRVTGLFLFC
jgi:hypothetical protein